MEPETKEVPVPTEPRLQEIDNDNNNESDDKQPEPVVAVEQQQQDPVPTKTTTPEPAVDERTDPPRAPANEERVAPVKRSAEPTPAVHSNAATEKGGPYTAPPVAVDTRPAYKKSKYGHLFD